MRLCPVVLYSGLNINVCPIVRYQWRLMSDKLILYYGCPMGQVKKIRDSQTFRYHGQIYFHWYNILGLLYKRALFDLQFVHNIFWLKLKRNARSKLFYCIIYRSSMFWWSSRTLTKLKSQSQKRSNERKYQYLKYKNKNHSGMDTYKFSRYQFGAKFKLVFCEKYDRGLDLGFWEILKPLKWTNITSFFLIWLKRSTKICISLWI